MIVEFINNRMLMDEMDLGLDDSLMSPTEEFEGGIADDTLGTLGATHSPLALALMQIIQCQHTKIFVMLASVIILLITYQRV